MPRLIVHPGPASALPRQTHVPGHDTNRSTTVRCVVLVALAMSQHDVVGGEPSSLALRDDVLHRPHPFGQRPRVRVEVATSLIPSFALGHRASQFRDVTELHGAKQGVPCPRLVRHTECAELLHQLLLIPGPPARAWSCFTEGSPDQWLYHRVTRPGAPPSQDFTTKHPYAVCVVPNSGRTDELTSSRMRGPSTTRVRGVSSHICGSAPPEPR